LTVIKSGAVCGPAYAGAKTPATKTDAKRPPSVVFPWLWLCGFQGPRRVGDGDSVLARSLKTQQRAGRAWNARPQIRSTCLRTGVDPRPRPASRTQSLERR